jgi:hypothetical protein
MLLKRQHAKLDVRLDPARRLCLPPARLQLRLNHRSYRKHEALLIGMPTRALTDSHYGKPKAIIRAFREPRTVASKPDRTHH